MQHNVDRRAVTVHRTSIFDWLGPPVPKKSGSRRSRGCDEALLRIHTGADGVVRMNYGSVINVYPCNFLASRKVLVNLSRAEKLTPACSPARHTHSQTRSKSTTERPNRTTEAARPCPHTSRALTRKVDKRRRDARSRSAWRRGAEITGIGKPAKEQKKPHKPSF